MFALVRGTLCIALAFVAAGSVSAQDWRLTGNSRVASGYSDNPAYAENPGSAERESVAEGGLELARRSERWQLSVAPRATFARYDREDNRDYNNLYLGAASTWMGERLNWQLDTKAARDSTRVSELDTTGLVQENSRREFLSVSGGPRWIVSETLSAGGTLAGSDAHYEDNATSGLTDYRYSSADLFASKAWNDRTTLTFSGRAGRLEAGGQETRDAGMTVSIDYSLNDLWSLNVGGGPSRARSAARSDDGYLFSGGFNRRGEYGQFSGGISRQLEATGRGALTRVDTASLAFGRRLTEWLTWSLTGQHTRTFELFSAASTGGYEARFSGVTSALTWHFAEAWTLSFNVEERWQEIHAAERDPYAADNRRISLALAWAGRTVAL